MQALYFDGALRYITDAPPPRPAEGESLVRVELAAICNTDREMLKGYTPGFTGILGHEYVGIVESSPDPALVGRRVVGEITAFCGECLYCNTGRQKHCSNRRTLGIYNWDGCFAEYLVSDTRLLHTVPDGLRPEEAVYTEPLAAALQVAECTHIAPGTPVAVIGDGRLSYMIAQVLALQGNRVTVFGKHEEKLATFAAFADTSLTPSGSFEVVVDSTGSPSGMETAMSLVRAQGRIVVKSTYASNVSMNLSALVVREVQLIGSRCGPFAPALQLLARGQITLPPIALYPLSAHEEAFAAQVFKAGFDCR